MRDPTKRSRLCLNRRLATSIWAGSVLLLAGCASGVSKPAPETQAVQPKVETPAGQSKKPTSPTEAKRPPGPAIPLTQDVLYKVLVAEIAVQRQQYELAVNNYMGLARTYRDPQLTERAARVALFSKQPQRALEASKLWVDIAPKDIEARQVLAAMLIRNGQADPALDHLEYVLAQEPEKAGDHLKMIINFLGHEKDRAVALRVMEKLLERRQDNPDALFAYALLAMRADEIDKAHTAMSKLVTVAPVSQHVAQAYVGILQKQGKQVAALDWLADVLAKDPGNFDLRLMYARLLADAKRYPEARTEFGTLLKQQPKNADVRFALGLLALQDNELEQARERFTELAQSEPYQNEASFYLGQIAESAKNNEEALRWYSSINSGALAFDAQLSSALVLARLQRFDEADERLTQAPAKTKEQQSRVLRVRGELLSEQKRYAEAMAAYDSALKESYDSELLYARAMLAEKMGRIDILERDLRQIIKRDPKNAQALNALGFTLADQTSRHQEAYRFIKQALELRPNDHYILDSMGWVLYRLGRLSEAATHLRRAKDLRNDPEIAAHLGEVLWKMGDKDGAREALQSGLQASPNDPKLIEVMQRMAQ